MLKRALRSSTHLLASVALMKLPSQKMAVCAMHPPVHFAWSDAVQLALALAWQLMSHIRLAWPLQLPWQLRSHSPMQSALGGVPEHSVLQRAAQLAWHWPVQVVWSEADEHAPEQLPSHVALQSVLQLKLPGLAE